MRLTVLGIGNSFTTNDAHTNFFIQHDDAGVLIDAGTTLRTSLSEANFNVNDISHIFITHFHHDHVGGLSELLLKSYWQFGANGHEPHIPTLILRREQLAELEAMLAPSMNNQQLTWRNFCHVAFFENGQYVIDNVTYTCVQTDHLHCEGMQSYGLQIKNERGNIIITGDIKQLHNNPFSSFVTPTTAAIFHDVSNVDNPLHCSYEEVVQHYSPALLKKIIAVHHDAMLATNNRIQYAQKKQRYTF